MSRPDLTLETYHRLVLTSLSELTKGLTDDFERMIANLEECQVKNIPMNLATRLTYTQGIIKGLQISLDKLNATFYGVEEWMKQ